jgi:hypothetical protein
MDFFCRNPNVGRSSFFRFGISLVVRLFSDLAARLRRVVFVGKPAFCQRFDFQCVGLRPEGPP